MLEVVLAFDQALRTTGYAVFRGEELADYGTFTVDPSLPMEERLHQLMLNVKSLKAKYDPDIICFEDIQDQHNIQTFKTLAHVQAAIMIFCALTKSQYVIMSPSHWRKILGGQFGKKRDEQKAHAQAIVKDRFGIDVDSDTADAICIGLAYIEQQKDK